MSPLLLGIPLAVVLGVSCMARRMIARYNAELPRGAMPKGGRIARAILIRHQIKNIPVEAGSDDFYSPLECRIVLSRDRIARRSTSSAAIAAHEAAHAVQHASRSISFMARHALTIPSALASLAWFPVAVTAAILDSDVLSVVAFALFGFTVAVSLITVWVEIDASRRAMAELHALRAPGVDHRAARNVLVACGATYVADTVLDLGFVGRRLRRDRDEREGASGSQYSDDAETFPSGLFD